MKTKTTIALANQKGGVGKTTSTINLAYALHSLGQRVLMIDSDPQASLTIYAGEDPQELEQQERTLLFAIAGRSPTPLSELIVERSGAPDLVASSFSLADADAALLDRGARILREQLGSLRDTYHYILIDTPPTLTALTVNALAAADALLIPSRTDYLSARGISFLFQTYEDLRRRINPRLWILGILPTLHNHYKHDREVLSDLKKAGLSRGIHVFDPIPRSTQFDASAPTGKPLVARRKTSKGALAYMALAKTINNKLP